MIPGDLVIIKAKLRRDHVPEGNSVGLMLGISKWNDEGIYIEVLIAGKRLAFHRDDLEILNENNRPSWY